MAVEFMMDPFAALLEGARAFVMGNEWLEGARRFVKGNAWLAGARVFLNGNEEGNSLGDYVREFGGFILAVLVLNHFFPLSMARQMGEAERRRRLAKEMAKKKAAREETARETGEPRDAWDGCSGRREGPRYLIVVDFECTCVQDSTYQQKTPWKHEIIEFPAVLLDLEQPYVNVFSDAPFFHRYVRPEENPRLSKFCVDLTGVSQSTVDAAPVLADVLPEFWAWIESLDVGDESVVSLAADGPWDLRKFLLSECVRKGIAIDDRLTTWVDVSLHLRKFYDVKKPGNLENKLALCGMRFEGRPHSGIADARNIARLALHLHGDGCDLVVNDGWGDDRITPSSRTLEQKKKARKQGRAGEGVARRLRQQQRQKLHDVDW